MRATKLSAKTFLEFDITPQPDLATCGLACLHAVYRYHRDLLPLEQVISEVHQFPGGGTLAVWLALHALRRGYRTTIYTCNLQLFDPTWFRPGSLFMKERLVAQSKVKDDPKLQEATLAYLDFLERGGELLMEDITEELIGEELRRGFPIIAGLSATWLYRCARERQTDMASDDVAGDAAGHFVVLHGLDRELRDVSVADPFLNRPEPGSHAYTVDADRLIGAILLGVLTYDAKLLIVRPASKDADS